MNDQKKTKAQLIAELAELRQRVAELELAEPENWSAEQAETARRNNEERFRELVEMLPEAIFETDRKLGVTFANQCAFELFGYSQEDLARGLHPLGFIAPEDRDRAKTNLALQSKGDDLKRSEYQGLKKDGSIFPILLHASSIKSDGEVIGIRGVIVDITKQKEAEQQLARQEKYYRTLMFSLHEDILVIDRDYLITDINNAALQTLGKRREDVIGRHCYEVSHGHCAPCNEHGEQCKLRSMFDTGESHNVLHDHVIAGGRTANVDIIMSPIKDGDGNVTHVVEAARDVTDLFQTQEALEKKRRAAEANRRKLPQFLPLDH